MTGRRRDGYHLLDSVVCFPAFGDTLSAAPARGLALELDGPFAREVTAADNLVLRAAAMIRPPGRGAALGLTKTLPVAAGLGGGSADAAAALRLLARLWAVALPAPERLVALGADVPACLLARAVRVGGVGEHLRPVALPGFWLVLVNPGVPMPTGAVFADLARRENPPLPPPPAAADLARWLAWLRATRNDLEPPAFARAPVIAEVRAALAAQPGCLLARMSGSGATCYGLFARAAEADAAARALARAKPDWWLAAAPVVPGPPAEDEAVGSR